MPPLFCLILFYYYHNLQMAVSVAAIFFAEVTTDSYKVLHRWVEEILLLPVRSDFVSFLSMHPAEDFTFIIHTKRSLRTVKMSF